MLPTGALGNIGLWGCQKSSNLLCWKVSKRQKRARPWSAGNGSLVILSVGVPIKRNKDGGWFWDYKRKMTNRQPVKISHSAVVKREDKIFIKQSAFGFRHWLSTQRPSEPSDTGDSHVGSRPRLAAGMAVIYPLRNADGKSSRLPSPARCRTQNRSTWKSTNHQSETGVD